MRFAGSQFLSARSGQFSCSFFFRQYGVYLSWWFEFDLYIGRVWWSMGGLKGLKEIRDGMISTPRPPTINAQLENINIPRYIGRFQKTS